MEEEKNIDDSRVNIFGYSKSRLEVFLNGIVFLTIQVAHEVIVIVKQLPEKWGEKDLLEVDRPMWIPCLFLFVSYLLMNYAVFGGEGRLDRMQKKHGTFRIFFIKYLMILGIIFISLSLPIYITLTFF